MKYASKQLLSHIVSVDPEFRSSIQWLWLGISHEITVKMSAGVTFILRLDWDVKMCFRDVLLMDWQLALALGRRPQFLIMWAIPLMYLSVIFTLHLVSPRVSHTRTRLKLNDFYELMLEHMPCHLWNIFLDTQFMTNQCGRELCECVTTRRQWSLEETIRSWLL